MPEYADSDAGAFYRAAAWSPEHDAFYETAAGIDTDRPAEGDARDGDAAHATRGSRAWQRAKQAALDATRRQLGIRTATADGAGRVHTADRAS